MTLSYQLTIDEYVKAGKILLSRQKKQYIGIFIAITVLYLLLTFSKESITQSLFGAIFYGVAMFFFFWLLIIFRIKMTYKKNKIYSKPVSVNISEIGFEIEYSTGKSFLKWKAFEGFKCNDELCILFTAKNCGHIIPLHILNSQELIQLQNILMKNIKPLDELK